MVGGVSGQPQQNLAPLLAECYQHAAAQNTSSFVKGLLLGQLSFILLALVILRYLLFDTRSTIPVPIPNKINANRLYALKKRLFGHAQSKPYSEHALHPVDQTILSGLPSAHRLFSSLNLAHPSSTQPSSTPSATPESCDWFNLLLAQLIHSLRSSAVHNSRILHLLSYFLNSPSRKPSYIADILLTDLQLGSAFPIFSHPRILLHPDTKRLGVVMDFRYEDKLVLGIDTEVLVNWPRALLAAMPVSLSVSLRQCSGTLHLNFSSSSTHSLQDTFDTVCIAIDPDYVLDLRVKSQLGHRTKIRDLPKISDLVVAKLRATMDQHLSSVHGGLHIHLPDIWKEWDVFSAEEGLEEVYSEPTRTSSQHLGMSGLDHRRRDDEEDAAQSTTTTQEDAMLPHPEIPQDADDGRLESLIADAMRRPQATRSTLGIHGRRVLRAESVEYVGEELYTRERVATGTSAYKTYTSSSVRRRKKSGTVASHVAVHTVEALRDAVAAVAVTQSNA